MLAETKDKFEKFCDGGHCDSEAQGSVSNTNCSSGFEWNEQIRMCEDVDECASRITKEPCPPKQMCVNRLGRYDCLALGNEFTCDLGYKKESNECLDIDECSQGVENKTACLENQICANQIGSYRCIDQTPNLTILTAIQIETTKPNATSFPSAQESTDIPSDYLIPTTVAPEKIESLGVKNGVDNVNQKANDQPRMPNVNPVAGDRLNVNKKSAPNETESDNVESWRDWKNFKNLFEKNQVVVCKTTSCGQDQLCSVLKDQIHCEPRCKQGETFDIVEDVCKSIHPCSQFDTCPPDHECKPLPRNKFTCLASCPNGFVRSDSNASHPKECVDMDECAGNHVCNSLRSQCFNTVGSYRCDCFKGFEHSNANDNLTCTDIDECLTSPCETGMCHNKLGGFECRCPSGYRKNKEMNRLRCGRVDNCKKNSCSAGHQCTSMRTSFRCTDIECPVYYQRYKNESR